MVQLYQERCAVPWNGVGQVMGSPGMKDLAGCSRPRRDGLDLWPKGECVAMPDTLTRRTDSKLDPWDQVDLIHKSQHLERGTWVSNAIVLRDDTDVHVGSDHRAEPICVRDEGI